MAVSMYEINFKGKPQCLLEKSRQCLEDQSGLEVIKLFSISAQLSMKFQLLIDVEKVKIDEKYRFKTQKLVIYPAHKC